MNAPSQPSRPRSSVALMLLIAGAVGLLLYFAHAVFVPIALAVLFALLLSSPVEGLNRRGLPRAASAALILLVVVAVIAGGIFALWSPAQKWFAAAPHTLSVIQHKLSGIILAIPGLVALKVAAEYHRHGKPLVEFLSASTAKRFAPRKRSSKSAGATVVA